MVTDQLMMLAVVASAIALLSAVLVFVVRARKISEQLSDLDALSEKLKMMSGAMEKRIALLQARDEIKRQHTDEIEEIVEASRSLQEWKSRITDVCLDAGYLFESEPIRELLDGFGPRPGYDAQPPGGSVGRSRKSATVPEMMA